MLLTKCIQNAYNICMPVVLRFGRFSFVIFPKDHRPAHVHVMAAGAEAKFELRTGKCIAATGFTQKTLSQIEEIVRRNSDLLMDAWRQYEGEE
jgi:hypothetical protein